MSLLTFFYCIMSFQRLDFVKMRSKFLYYLYFFFLNFNFFNNKYYFKDLKKNSCFIEVITNLRKYANILNKIFCFAKFCF